MKNKILVCGAGAVGGYFGGRLAQNPENDVIFLAHGKTYQNLINYGLRIKSISGDFTLKANAVNDPVNLEPVFDYLLICVKLYNNKELLEKIIHLFSDNVITVTLQNGLSGYEELKDMVKKKNNLLQGICRISSELRSDGIIYHTALGKIITGEYYGYGKKASMKLLKLFTDSSVKGVISDNFKLEIWVKYAWNAIFNTLTALHMKSTDELFADDNLKTQIIKLYGEISEIAETQHVKFGNNEYKMIISDTMNLGKFQTSSYFDRFNGKKTEVPMFLSFLKTLAVRNNIETRFLNELIKITEKEKL